MSSTRKIKRAVQKKFSRPDNLLTETEYELLMHAAVDQVKEDYIKIIAKGVGLQMLAITGKILSEDFGKLQKKETRLSNYLDLYARGVEALSLDITYEEYKKQLMESGFNVEWVNEGYTHDLRKLVKESATRKNQSKGKDVLRGSAEI